MLAVFLEVVPLKRNEALEEITKCNMGSLRGLEMTFLISFFSRHNKDLPKLSDPNTPAETGLVINLNHTMPMDLSTFYRYQVRSKRGANGP